MRRRILAGAVVVLGLATAACGQAPDRTVRAEATPAYLAHAAAQTLDAGTGRYELTAAVHAKAGAPAGVDGTVSAVGEYDNASKSTDLTLDLGPLLQGLVDQAPSGASGALSKALGDAGAKVRIVQTGTDVYLDVPTLGGLLQLFGGRTTAGADSWVKVDLSTIDGLDTSGLGTTDPSVFLKLLDGASGDVHELGTVQVRGVDTTGYATTFTLADVLARTTDATTRAKVQKLADRTGMSELFDTPVPMQIYVDADGLVRRVVDDFDLAQVVKSLPAKPGVTVPDVSGTVRTTLDFYDFGASDIHIDAPPASQVVDLAQLLPGLAGGGHK